VRLLGASDDNAQPALTLTQLYHLGLALLALGAGDERTFLCLAVDMERPYLGRAKNRQVVNMAAQSRLRKVAV